MRRLLNLLRRTQQGMTLVELLVGVAITTMVITMASGLLYGAMSANLRVRQQTEQYESLRLAAAMFMQDGGRAYTSPMCNPSSYLWLYTKPDQSELTEYNATPNGSAGLVDIHRREWTGVPTSGPSKGVPYAGGTMVNDYTVAQGVNETPQSGYLFSCFATSAQYPQGQAQVYLEKPPLSGQAQYTAINAVAFPRSK